MTTYKPLILFLLAIVLIAAIGAARAQSVEAQADLSWTLPTTDTLGDPLTGASALTKVQVFASLSAIPDTGATPLVELAAGATAYDYQGEVPNGSTLYFRVAACNALCSALSPQATKEVRVSVPGVPTGVTITLKVNLQVQP